MSGGVGTALAGREEELAQLDGFVHRARTGGARLLLEGEPGIGKTTLWRAGVERARDHGFRVVAAQQSAAERELSFAALGDLLSAATAEIGGLAAPQRRALRIALVLEEPRGDPPDERAIAIATLELLRRLAAEGPVLVALDDVQWLDRASASVLSFALRRLGDEPVGVLATARTEPDGLLELAPDERLVIGPLSMQALDRLVRTRLGVHLLRPTLRRLEQASGGNPFYALELAASLLRSGRRLEPGEELPIPESLRELVAVRLATLTPAGRRAALAAAALAQPTEAALRSAARGGSDPVGEAVGAGVLVRDGGSICFSHPLLAATLYEDASPAERRRVHRRLATIVADPEERARHLAEAAEGPDEAVADALEAAAASVAARGAADAAARLAKRAAELTPPVRRDDAQRRRLAWARYVFAAGDPRHAQTLLEQQLALAGAADERAAVELELGRVALGTQGTAAARRWFEEALGELEGTSDVELRARVLVELTSMLLENLEYDSDVFEQALVLAEELGTPELLSRALGAYAARLELSGQQPSEEYWRRALAVEELSGELRFDGPTSARGHQLSFLESRFEAGAALLRKVASSMQRRSDPLLPTLLLRLSDAARNSGAWADADRYIEEASVLVSQTGRESLVPDCLVYEGRMAMLRGDLEPARERTEQGLSLFEELSSASPPVSACDEFLFGLGHSVLGRIASQAGRHAEAHTWFVRHTAQLRAAGDRGTLVESLAEDIAALLETGALDEASRALSEIVGLAAEVGLPWAEALAARSRGRVAAARGDMRAALAELERAVDVLEAEPETWTYELGRTLLVLGSVQRRARSKSAARATLERALGIFETLGAKAWAEKTRTELRLIGGRASSPGKLTEAERRIAELVAAGRSNAEVARELSLSPKTVEWNLSKIYRKLHVRSRTELAAKLARRAVPA